MGIAERGRRRLAEARCMINRLYIERCEFNYSCRHQIMLPSVSTAVERSSVKSLYTAMHAATQREGTFAPSSFIQYDNSHTNARAERTRARTRILRHPHTDTIRTHTYTYIHARTHVHMIKHAHSNTYILTFHVSIYHSLYTRYRLDACFELIAIQIHVIKGMNIPSSKFMLHCH